MAGNEKPVPHPLHEIIEVTWLFDGSYLTNLLTWKEKVWNQEPLLLLLEVPSQHPLLDLWCVRVYSYGMNGVRTNSLDSQGF